jgi:hypothetical protein
MIGSGSTFFLYRQKESSKENLAKRSHEHHYIHLHVNKARGCALLLCSVPAKASPVVAAKGQGHTFELMLGSSRILKTVLGGVSAAIERIQH